MKQVKIKCRECDIKENKGYKTLIHTFTKKDWRQN